MSELLNSVALVEKELSLLQGILNYIYIYDKKTNELVVQLNVGLSERFDSALIGGLVCTIEEFAGENINRELRYITLDNLKVVFLNYENFILTLGVDSNYPSKQFEQFMEVLHRGFDVGYNIQTYGAGPNGATLTLQIIMSLISEEFNLSIDLNDKLGLFPYKLQELASEIIDSEINKGSGEDIAAVMGQINVPVAGDQGSDGDEDIQITSAKQALHTLLERFVATFSDILSITFIHTSMEGNLERITHGTLTQSLENSILNIILGMIDTVSLLLDKDDDARTLDLDGNWLYFQQISLTSFIYVIVENYEALDNVRPLVERIAMSIKNLFPDEVY